MKNNLLKLLTKRRIKGLIILFISLVTSTATMFVNKFAEQMLSAVSIVSLLIALDYILITPEKGRKIVCAIKEILIFVTQKIFDFVKMVISRFSFSNGRSFKATGMIKGYSDTSERINTGSYVTKTKKKHKRYKNMDNIEKVRYLYEKKITGALKRGIPLEESMTPNEAGELMKQRRYMKKSENVLIGTYNFARYDEEALITDEMVKNIK